MTRILRRLFRLAVSCLCLLSLLACVGTGWLWWRSYRAADDLSWEGGRTILSLQSSDGRCGLYTVQLVAGEFAYTPRDRPGLTHGVYPPDDPEDWFVRPDRSWHEAGFALTWYAEGPKRFRNVLLPYWSILPLLIVFPTVRLRWAWVWRRRRRMGLCLRCGFDLRASADRCPECGTVLWTQPA